MSWIGQQSDEVDLDEIALLQWAELSERMRLERIEGFLELTLAILWRHYDFGDRHRWKRLAVSKVANEIAERLNVGTSEHNRYCMAL